MAIAVRYDATTRALLGAAPTEAALGPPVPNTITVTLTEWADVPPAPYTWQPALANFAIRPRTALLTQREFLARWRAAGLGAVLTMIFTLEVQDSPQGAAAREWLTEFRSARGIDPADPDTIANTDAVLALAVTAAVITQAQADAGRPIVLAPLGG